MAMLLDSVLSKCGELLANYVYEEVIKLVGVEDELRKLQQQMESIQSLLQDAEKKRFDESSSTDLWLSRLKDVMYDADDIMDRCMILGAELLADQDSKSITYERCFTSILRYAATSPVCCNFSSAFSCFTSIPLRHEIADRIKELNDRLDRIYRDRKQFKLEKSTKSESPQITLVDSRVTASKVNPLVVGREVEDAANRLVDCLVEEQVEEKCRLFAVTGMGGIGKTTLAQMIFNHKNMKENFKLKIWVCISQTYSEIELLKQIIRGAKGSYGEANTKAELYDYLTDSIASGQSLFLVLDDVWRADVWVDLLSVPLYDTNVRVRVLVTTRDENVAKGMDAAHIHSVPLLSPESGWDMLCRLVFRTGEEEQANELKDVGLKIVKKCGHLPLAIKVIGVVLKKEHTRKAWNAILSNKAWSSNKLPEELRALYLSFEDLPSHLKQCFLYFSLYPEDDLLFRKELARLWVAEGFITEQDENSLMEEVAEKYFDELLLRNLLQPYFDSNFVKDELARHWVAEGFITEQDENSLMKEVDKKYFDELLFKNLLQHQVSAFKHCTMHDVIRSLTLFLSKEESSFRNENMKKSGTSTKLRRLSIALQVFGTVAVRRVPAAQILDSVADQGALRTLLASSSDLLLDHERLTKLSRLRVLDISYTKIELLPDSIGSLVHLRYLDLSCTNITAIPESIQHLAYLQFLIIRKCKSLTQLPGGIIRLDNLRYLHLSDTPLCFMPKGMGNLKQLNVLKGFVVANNDSSCQLEELNSLKQIRKLKIRRLQGTECGGNILGELSRLSDLELQFTEKSSEQNVEEQLAVEKLFDELRPPPNLEELIVSGFFGRYFPNWMALSTFERCVPHLTILRLDEISSCTQLPPLGQMPELRKLYIWCVHKVKKIGPEFIGGGVISAVNSSTKIVFPKLEELCIYRMTELEEWSFGAQVEENVSPRLNLLPCLQKVSVYGCPLLKKLPKGLKYSSMKVLYITSSDSLESLDDLPSEIEELSLIYNEKLKKVCWPPALKELVVCSCKALSYVENLDALQYLSYYDRSNHSFLPEWLLMLLQQQGLQNDSNESFRLNLECSKKVLQECLKGGSYWDLIQHIPIVTAHERHSGNGYLRYEKQPYVYDTNL